MLNAKFPGFQSISSWYNPSSWTEVSRRQLPGLSGLKSFFFYLFLFVWVFILFFVFYHFFSFSAYYCPYLLFCHLCWKLLCEF